MDRNFGGVVWTNHILQRMKERGLSQQDILWVFQHPDKTLAASSSQAYRFTRNYRGLRIEVIAKKEESNKWILMSCWTRPLYQKKILFGKWSWLWRIPEFVIKTILGK